MNIENTQVFFGSHAADGVLYEMLDDDLNVIGEVTIPDPYQSWHDNV